MGDWRVTSKRVAKLRRSLLLVGILAGALFLLYAAIALAVYENKCRHAYDIPKDDPLQQGTDQQSELANNGSAPARLLKCTSDDWPYWLLPASL